MNLNNTIEIKINEIDFDDNTFQISTEKSIDKLCSSIEYIGLINNPVLKIKKNESKQYKIICGFKRLKALKQLKFNTVIIKLVNEDDLTCAILAILDNSHNRQLNLIEQSRAINLISSFISEDKDLYKVLSNIGFINNRKIIKKISKLCKMPFEIQNAVIENKISLKISEELATLTEDESVKISNFFCNFNLSFGKQIEFLEYIKDISKRDNISILKILYSNEIHNILNNNDIDNRIKADEIRYYIKKKRFPNLSNKEEIFNNEISKLKLLKGMQFQHSPFFEGDSYTINMKIKNNEDLKKFIKKLEDISKHLQINDLDLKYNN